MTQTQIPRTVPRWRSISLRDLFRAGPWELVLVVWVIGALLAYAWLTEPVIRVAVVTDWRFAAFAFGALAGLVTARISLTLYGNPRALGRHLAVCAATIIGGIGGALAARGPWRVLVEQATGCAPIVAIGITQTTRLISFGLPVFLWASWCAFLLTGFPAAEGLHHGSTGGATTRYRVYADALRMLPVKVIVTGAMAIALLATVRQIYVIDFNRAELDALVQSAGRLPPQEIDAQPLLNRVAEARSAAEKEALTSLLALRFDDAVSPTRIAACSLRFPTDVIDPRVEAAQRSFETLDREMAGNRSDWIESPPATRAIVNLLPINPASQSVQSCPLFWPSDRAVPPGGLESIANLRVTTLNATYKGTEIVEARLATIPRDERPLTLEVAMKVAGVASTNSGILQDMERRLGSVPSEGPKTIGEGAACATWTFDRIGIRVGPAVAPTIPDSSMTPNAPLWITCYDRELSSTLQPLYTKPNGRSWSPHHCGLLPD